MRRCKEAINNPDSTPNNLNVEKRAGRVREQWASRRGGLIVRVGAGAYGHALAGPHAAAVEMSGRPMRGWVLIDAAGVSEPDHLRASVERGLAFARALPPKHRQR